MRVIEVFCDFIKIERAQVIQHQIDRIEIVVQTQTSLSSLEKNKIVQRLQSQLGDVTVFITEVTRIEQTQNGKFKAVISKLKN